MDVIQAIALTLGAGWASGINLYAAVLMLGILGATGNVDLPEQLAIVSDPMVLGAAGLMYFVEFFADKIPGADTAWDALHTFIRIPAGALLAAGAAGDMGAGAEFAAFLVGGGLATASHATKAGSRVVINTSPEPFTNWTASITEDLAVIGGLWAALNHPVVFLVLLAVFILLLVWLLPKLWRAIKTVVAKISAFFGKQKAVTEQPPPDV